MKRVCTEITVPSPKIHQPVTFAVVADLHNAPYQDALPWMRGADAILIVGDLINRHREGYSNAAAFLRDAPAIAPTYYSIGNHERKFDELEEYWPIVERSDVTVLDNSWIRIGDVVLGGCSSIFHPNGNAMRGLTRYQPRAEDAPAFLCEMAAEPGFRLLMCHHPEYFEPYVTPWDIDLTLAGHAHGGQICIGHQGLYAPGQGIMPKLTHGWYFDRRLFVSRGMTNSTRVPRLHNPCELILLHLTPEKENA